MNGECHRSCLRFKVFSRYHDQSDHRHDDDFLYHFFLRHTYRVFFKTNILPFFTVIFKVFCQNHTKAVKTFLHKENESHLVAMETENVFGRFSDN